MARKLLIPLSAAVAGALIAAAPAAAATVTDCADLQDALNEETTVTLAQGLTCTGRWSFLDHAGHARGRRHRRDPQRRRRVADPRGRRRRRGPSSATSPSAAAATARRAAARSSCTATARSRSRTRPSPTTTPRGPAARFVVDRLRPGRETAEAPRGRRGRARRHHHRQHRSATTMATRTRAARGGALAVRGYPLELSGSDFTDNVSGGSGGGLAAYALGPVTLTGNTFTGNVSVREGGGAAVSFCADSTVTDNTFADNAVFPFPDQKGREAASEVSGHAEGGGLWATQSFCFGRQDVGARRPRVHRRSTQCGQRLPRQRARRRAPRAPAAAPASTSSSSELHLDRRHVPRQPGRRLGRERQRRRRSTSTRGAASRSPPRTSWRRPTEIPDGEGGGDQLRHRRLRGRHAASCCTRRSPPTTPATATAARSTAATATTLGAEQLDRPRQCGLGREISGFEETDLETLGGPVPGDAHGSATPCRAPARARSPARATSAPTRSSPNAAGGDVHQTSGQPDARAARRRPSPASSTKDYEGDARKLDYDRWPTAPSRTWAPTRRPPRPARRRRPSSAAARRPRRPAACSARRRAAAPRAARSRSSSATAARRSSRRP